MYILKYGEHLARMRNIVANDGCCFFFISHKKRKKNFQTIFTSMFICLTLYNFCHILTYRTLRSRAQLPIAVVNCNELFNVLFAQLAQHLSKIMSGINAA